jgi:hypothetical protein
LAYQPPASSTFLSEQISHQQSDSSTFLSEQTSTSHQPPTKRTGWATATARCEANWSVSWCHLAITGAFYIFAIITNG